MKLRPEQATAVKIIEPDSVLLLADVGAGKTATALTAIKRKLLLGNKRRVLVVGTKRICDMVWGEEIAKWAPYLAYLSVAGKDSTYRKDVMLNPHIDIVGLNFANLIWAINTFGEQLPAMFPWLVIDESSKLENPKSKSFQAIKPLLPLFEWRLPMTGTPRANHLYDLWGSVYLADCGASLGNYREAFLQKWFHEIRTAAGVKWIPKHEAENDIYNRVKGTVHRMPFHSPDPIEIDIVLPLNLAVQEIQNTINALVVVDEDITLDGVTYVRKGRRQHTKQLQLSAGLVYTDDGNVIELHRDKLDALQELVAEAKGEPMMVVFQFDHERDAILEAFPQARLLHDDDTLKEWNAGQIEMLLVHPLSCGHGLNAQFSGSDLQVWFTPTTDGELYRQTVGRMNRPGASKTIRVIRLIMEGTKDRNAYLIVAGRMQGENATLDMFEDDNN